MERVAKGDIISDIFARFPTDIKAFRRCDPDLVGLQTLESYPNCDQSSTLRIRKIRKMKLNLNLASNRKTHFLFRS